ncbi:MAG: hypothetical protein ACFFDN_35955 [Candidatus Hodarchaeota archaeon]
MGDINHVMNIIKEELKAPEPSRRTILSYLFGLRTKKERSTLSDSEFFDVVGETFKLDPNFFMEKLYYELRHKILKLYGHEGRKFIERYIVEKYCLNNGEQILHECHGKLYQALSQFRVKVGSGSIFFTNYRIIAQGRYLDNFSFSSNNKLKAIKLFGLLNQNQECFGYVFPIKNLHNLRKKRHSIKYELNLDNCKNYIEILSSSFKTNDIQEKIIELLNQYK